MLSRARNGVSNGSVRTNYSVEYDGPDNVYFNAIFPGPENTNDFQGPQVAQAEFAITRTTSIIPNCSDYYCSVVRFAIPLNEIPILLIPILPGCDTYGPPFPAAPRNITPFIVGVRYNGVTYTQTIAANDFTGVGGPNLSSNVVFQPSNFTVAPVFQTSLLVDKIDPAYLGIFNYTEFVEMINVALLAAFTAFAVANPAAPQALTAAPFFKYDQESQLFSLIAPSSWITTYAQAVPDPAGVARVCCNLELGQYFSGFREIYVTDNTPIPANQINFLVENEGDNGYPTNTYPAVPAYLQMIQDYRIIANWNSLRKIVITTNTLPIQTEAIPTGDATTGVSSNRPIITDFVPQLNEAGDTRSVAYYNPSAQYRLVDMNQGIPLQKIDLKIYWEDKDSNLYPLNIRKYDQASVKLGFFKKSLYRENAFNPARM